jgi:hypothetical protein
MKTTALILDTEAHRRLAPIIPATAADVEEAAGSIAAPACTHPPRRLYSGHARCADGEARQWVACCDCGDVLTPSYGAKINPPERSRVDRPPNSGGMPRRTGARHHVAPPAMRETRPRDRMRPAARGALAPGWAASLRPPDRRACAPPAAVEIRHGPGTVEIRQGAGTVEIRGPPPASGSPPPPWKIEQRRSVGTFRTEP